MANSKMLVFSNAVAGQDDAFNEWYDTRHLADVTAVPGVRGGERYDLVPGPGDPPHRYLAVYELSGDPGKVLEAFRARAATGEIALSPALDMSTLAVSVWRARGSVD
ncbi:hypothetical protein [Nocardia wallacei]|uniref:Ethyl tert-butyl ether degradation protein EthD n=1 Tax=Nocardia wallacei TaxID=480035 RepID=A0A7G1KJC8_9NOCA|nr:hypothetical protein [Nocardia wallacei]BCK54951.1 hypothetical protein NWFMUON74_27230 [Nocardia wallacei]